MYIRFDISGSDQLGLTSGWLRSQQPFIHPCGKVCLHPVVKNAHNRFRSASQGPRQQAFLPLKAESGKVCPLYSSSMAFLPPSNLGYAKLNWANGGKVCLFFLFCFHCSQQVTFFIQHIETVS